MLVLGRRKGQDIEVSGPARFRILDAIGTVRIGVEADRSVDIIRSELIPAPAEACCDVDDEPDEGGEGGGNR